MDHATCFRLLSATHFATSLLPLTVRLIPVLTAGTERVSGTHPERLSGTHLGFQNGHSGQEWQSSVYSGFRPFLDFIDSRKR